MTLGRGDGLLGMQPQGKLGPRGDSATLVQIDWTYRTDSGATWATRSHVHSGRPPCPSPGIVRHRWPRAAHERNLAAEADAMTACGTWA